MKVFAGSYIAVKSGFFGLLVGGAILAMDVAADWMPSKTVVYALLGVIAAEMLARFGRRGVEGWQEGEPRIGIFTHLLQAFFENTAALLFYTLTAACFHLLTLLYAHSPESIFYALATTLKQAYLFGIALMSINFTIINLRGEEGAKLFWRKLFSTWRDPRENADAFVNDKEGNQ